MPTRILLCLLAIWLVGGVDSAVWAQSIFGSRGPISAGVGTRRPFSPTAGSSGPDMGTGTPAGTTPAAGGFVGRGNPRGQFVGARRVTQPNTPPFVDVQRGSPSPSPPRTAVSESSSRTTPQVRDSRSGRRPVRARDRIAFSFDSPQPADVDAALASQFTALANRYAIFSAISAEAAPGGHVTLRGEVPSDDERRLVELLVQMQPGVRSVQNELTTPEKPDSDDTQLKLR